MRREEAIRRHLDDLRWAYAQPCGCAAAGHRFECEQGARMMAASIKTLEWVLGENDDIGGTVEKLAAAHARAERGG